MRSRTFNVGGSVPTEDQEQIALMRWADHHPVLRNLLIHIPNGGSRHLLEAVKLKRMGVKAGVPDTILPVARNGKHGLWVEMKRREKSKVTDEQRRMQSLLAEQGYQVSIAYGFLEAKKIIEDYLKPTDKEVNL